MVATYPASDVVRPHAADVPLFSTLVASRPGREGRAGALASVISIALHVGLVALLFWATMNANDAVSHLRETIIALPPLAPAAPPAPTASAAPAAEGQTGAPGRSVTIMPPSVILPDIPLPGPATTLDPIELGNEQRPGVVGGVRNGAPTVHDLLAGAPIAMQMTVRPTIRNRDDVARALQRFYPALLRDAGIGGTVVVWFLIDVRGNVVRTQVQQSSGHAGLDAAALRVGDLIEFTPAMNRERAVPVWIQWPITFRPGS